MAWLYLTRRTDLFDGRPKRVLHLAPEQCLEDRLRARLGVGYVTATSSIRTRWRRWTSPTSGTPTSPST